MLKLDLHLHSQYSDDGKGSPTDIIKSLKKKGLQGMAITDHNSIEGSLNALKVTPKGFIVVPGVGFDEKGRRIGHGKGVYDNLLKNSNNALHVGLAFEFQIVEKIPTNKWDFPVDKIITEDRVIDCRH